MANPVRVLHVVTQMNRAGLESRLMDIYRQIDKTKVQFDFYTCRKERGFFDDEIVSLGGRIYYSDSLSLQKILKIPNRFQIFFQQHQEYKIVHCHLNQWCGLILKGAKKANIPVRIAHSRTSLETKSVKNIVKNILKLSVNKYATDRFAVSKRAGTWLYGKNVVDKGLVTVWPNAVDCKKFSFNKETRKKYRDLLDLRNSFTLIHVGNIRPEKNHSFLIDVFAELKNQSSDAKLLIIGKDYLNGIIHQHAKKKKADSDIVFLGARSDVAELMQAGDVFVFPSLYEGFPGAVLEAEAAGLPCIISDTITDEVCVTDVDMLSLRVGRHEWVKKVLQKKYFTREDTYKILKDSGYDISAVTESLTNFYICKQKGFCLK